MKLIYRKSHQWHFLLQGNNSKTLPILSSSLLLSILLYFCHLTNCLCFMNPCKERRKFSHVRGMWFAYPLIRSINFWEISLGQYLVPIILRRSFRNSLCSEHLVWITVLSTLYFFLTTKPAHVPASNKIVVFFLCGTEHLKHEQKKLAYYIIYSSFSSNA